jgi:hypothetical protein
MLSISSATAFKNNPPGTIPLNDSIFIDQYPVKILDYVEFLNSIKTFYNESFHDSIQKLPKFGIKQEHVVGLKEHFKGDSILYNQMLTRTWMTYANDEKKYDIDFHIRSQRFYNYPIINITYEQMRYYCQWRTDMVMLFYSINCKNEKQRLKFPMNFQYRLAKRKEWEFAISKYIGDINKGATEKSQTDKPNNIIKPYKPTKNRNFYYDVDNAAETLENGLVTFNFTWNEKVRYGNINYFKMEEPADWISFRCVCEILPVK